MKFPLVFVCAHMVVAHYPHRHPNPSEYPNDYTPDDRDYDSDRTSFDGIYERRKNFDVESPMEFATDSTSEADQQHYGNQPPADLTNDDSIQSSDPNSSPTDRPSDDYASESVTETNSKSLLSDGCLRCLCEASSDCDPQVRCHVEGPNAYNCGPFQINANYWNDAGSPGADQNDPLDFEECMNDIECSIDTVNGYMQKYGKDCDGDGKVSCDDYAKVHKAGANNCNSSWIANTPFWNKYKECYFEY